MALTRAQIQTAFQNSLGRAASQSDENSYFSVSQSGALTDAQIFSTISNSREADQIADPVIRFYQAAFGRVPDQAGLQNAENYVRAFSPTAATYQNLSNMFAQSTEFTNRFGTGTAVDAAYVQALYSTILGRSATSAEVDGYVSGAAGYTTRGGVLYAVSQSSEAIRASDTAVNGFQLNAAQGQAVYSGTLYTSQNGSTTTPGQGAGTTFSLTANADALVGGDQNDTFAGSNSASATQFTAADSINGGGGNDTLRLDLNASYAGGATITNVETITTTFSSGGNFNASGITGVTTFDNNASTAAVTYANVGSVAGLTVRNTTGLDTTISYTDAAVAGTADRVALTLDNVLNSGGTPAIININSTTALGAGAESVAITTQGGASTIQLASNDTTITSLTASGASNLNVALGTNVTTSITNIDTSALTGNLTLSGLGAVNNTILTGSGNDTVNFGANLNTADVVNLGAGTDFLGANAAQLAAFTTTATNISNVEGLLIADDFGAAATVINASLFGSINNVRVADQSTTGIGNLTVNGLTNNANVRFDGDVGANGGVFTFNETGATDPGTANALNLDLRGGALTATSTVATAGVETINISTANATAAKAFNITDAALTNLNVSGLQGVDVSGAALGANVASVDASGLNVAAGSAGLTATLSAGAATGANIIGSAGVDTVVGSNLRDIFNLGAGNDVHTGLGGADTFNLAAGGNDVIVYTGTGQSQQVAAAVGNLGASVTTAGADVVTSANAGDVLRFTQFTAALNATPTDSAAQPVVGTDTALAANEISLIRGAYNAGTNLFTFDINGADTLAVYDAASTAATSTFEATVLVGFRGTGTLALTGGVTELTLA